jgi:hypothetical protein
MHTPQSHLAGVVRQVHGHVHVGTEKCSNCDHREANGSRQELKGSAGELCVIK